MARRRKSTEWDMEMGFRLKKLREETGLSQAQLAAAADMPVSTLRYWEYGLRTPLLDAAARVAIALGVSLDELAGIGTPEQAPAKKGSK
jgi:transcriptional regulator with XRE-family HTH domain